MLVKKVRRRLPRNAVEMLVHTCEVLSEEWDKPATEIFKGFLELMNKYADYFFSKPWPEKFDYAKATTFTDEDMDFLFGGRKNELLDRYMAMRLKKNVNMETGFQGVFGMYWTHQAFEEKFFRPLYKPVLEAFEKFAQENKDAREVLAKLKKQFDARLIHDSLVDLIEHEPPNEFARRILIGEMFELLHTVERLKPCGDYRCEWLRSEISRIK